MTVIVGYFDEVNSVMHISGDTLVTHSDFSFYHLKSKIQKLENHGILIGYAGSLAPIHAVKMNLDVPVYTVEEYISEFDYISRQVASQISEIIDVVLREGDAFGALIGFRGKFYEIDERGLVTEAPNNFYAMGTGDKTAYGSLYTTKDMDIPVIDKLRIAMEATSKVIFNVKEPFTYESIQVD